MPAFLILAHRSAAMCGDLFRYLYTENSRIFLHIDEKAPPALHELARGLAAAFETVSLLPPRACSWGGYSLVAATREAIRLALARPGFGHLLILSEQHVPLVPAADIGAALTPGLSEIQMIRWREMDPSGREDVRNRFAWQYRELPGVGMFATAKQNETLPLEIFHGSQWMVLDEGLCRTIAATSADICDLFAGALLADETALQTIAGLAGVANTGRNLTWVATPERIGNSSMLFEAPHFLAAKTKGRHLFIRKRGDELPAAVRATLEPQAAFTSAQLAAIIGRQDATYCAVKPLLTTAELVLHLRWHLHQLTPDLTIEAFAPPVNAPACYIRLAYPGAGSTVSLSVLSEDLRHFKIVLAWHVDFDGDFSDRHFHGLTTSVIRARVFGLAYQREIHLPNAAAFGFVTLGDGSDVSALVASLRNYVAILEHVSSGP